jgi:putative spermidine/putrescine transport system permease protein
VTGDALTTDPAAVPGADPAADPGADIDGKPALRHRLAEHGVDRLLLLLAPVALFFGLLFVYPFFYGVGLSVQPETGGRFANFQRFWADPHLRDTVATTLWLAIPATAINVVASVPVAYRLRGRFRGKRSLTTLLVVPVTLGTVLTAEGLLTYLGPTGWFNRTLRAIGLIDEPLQLIHNYWGVLFSLVITGFPFAFLLTHSYLTGIDPTLERAAATLGAGRWQRFRHVTLPLLAPGLAIVCCLNFVLAFSVFPSAVLVGEPAGATRVISIAAYQAAFEQYDYSMAAAITTVMGGVEFVVIAAILVWRSRLYRGSTRGRV